MNWKTLLYSWNLLLIFWPLNGAYDIPNVDLRILKENGFQVSIPDEPGVQSVFYMLQVDDSCPAIMDYITLANNGSWSSSHQTSLHNNDKLKISLLVQYNDVIYEKSETRVILNNRHVTTRNTQSHGIDYSSSQEVCEAYLQLGEPSKRCKPTITIASHEKEICKGELLFEDNFNAAQLNLNVWTHDIRQRMYHTDEELVAFDNSSSNSYLRDGQLHIVPTVAADVDKGAFNLGDRCTAVDNRNLECNIALSSFKIYPPVYSAQLHTRKSFSFKYGKVTVRAKLPKGDWIFPYLMLQPISTYAETHNSKQMRIAFARGNTHLHTVHKEDISGNRLYGGMIFLDHRPPVQVLKNTLSANHFGDDFHNYTMIWQRNKLTLMVDDKVYGEIDKYVEVFNEKCFIIFGVTVGGFQNFDDKILPKDVKPYYNYDPRAALSFWQNREIWASTWSTKSAMVIDYVRVYAE